MLLHLGSTGADVTRLEVRLRDLGLYAGGTDNIYGAGAESAVKAFQASSGIAADGVVGDQTWTRLFPAPEPPAVPASLNQRCLALTGTFETSAAAPNCYAGLAGDFDGQGLSFGALQWNLGQGTLQPLLAEMLSRHKDVMGQVFHDNLDDLRTLLALPRASQLAWARGIQDARHNVTEPWKGLFKALGLTPEFQAIQVENASDIHAAARQLCEKFGVTTERAAALMFDIRVQNGSINAEIEAKIRADFAAIPGETAPMDAEVAKLQSVANRRAEASKPACVEDVRTRKLTIANGTGTVHGMAYDLDRQFGIGLRPMLAGYKL